MGNPRGDRTTPKSNAVGGDSPASTSQALLPVAPENDHSTGQGYSTSTSESAFTAMVCTGPATVLPAAS